MNASSSMTQTRFSLMAWWTNTAQVELSTPARDRYHGLLVAYDLSYLINLVFYKVFRAETLHLMAHSFLVTFTFGMDHAFSRGKFF